MSNQHQRYNIPVGTRFGRLTTTSECFMFSPEPGFYPVSFVKVLCDCGVEKTVRATNLNNPRSPTMSCGCLRREVTTKKDVQRGLDKCGHPQCNGNHNHSIKNSDNACPGLVANRKKWSKDYLLRHKKPKHVYAILINDSVLKIGCTTNGDVTIVGSAKHQFNKRYGEVENATHIWNCEGDEGLEIYLQWRAGRTWGVFVQWVRHSEWFDVAGVSSETIVKILDLWVNQIGVLDSLDAEATADA
jgi:hypothetical protein